MSTRTRKLTSSEDELHDVAIGKTGLDDFGHPAYRRGLRVLLDAFDNDLQLTETGWKIAYEAILGILIARLYTQKGWAARPEALTIPIRKPLVIVGLPRTGTTALHKLLSADPQFQGLEIWLSQTPMVRPLREAWETQPEYRACVANREGLYSRIPELRKVHEIVAGDVAECIGVLLQSFVSSAWPANFGLPTYACWLLSQNARDSYRRYVDVLRLIGAREPHKRWLLKNPFHMVEIDTLLEVFPDACIVQTHRDPLQSIPSLCSLLHLHQRDFEGDAARADVLGPRQCIYWRNALGSMQAARQRLPTQFFDVDYRCFVADPLGTIHSIYEYFRLTLSLHTEQLMRAWVAANPTSKHGKHQYIVDSWGITSSQICDTFTDYRARHQFA